MAAGAFVYVTGAQPVTALVCAIAPDDPQNPGLVERTIVGQQPMGGNFDVVVLGVIDGIGETDADGYRQAAMSVQVVLRGEAPREYSFAYPAAADEPQPMFVRGGTYLVAIESAGPTGGPTASECSATQRITNPNEIRQYVDLSADPVIYEELQSVPASTEVFPMWIFGGLLAVILVIGLGWLTLHASPTRRR